jgi:glutamyl-tRNA reductase
MSIIAIGVNHKTAPVEIRERMSFSEGSLQEAYTKLLAGPVVRGCVIISTCNRTEIYAHVMDVEPGVDAVINLLRQKSGVEPALIKKYTYILTGNKTVHHLFRVAAGLDSMLLGETQILGQVRDAYQSAQKHSATDKVINTLFMQAIAVGKRARAETGIDRHAVSISYAAVELAKQFFGKLTGRSVLVVGAGKMSELTAKHLVANGVSGVIVSNRSYERAVCLARQFNGRAVKFDELYGHLGSADIVISCTAASHYVVRTKGVQQVLAENPGKKIMMIDIAVPRDIEPGVRELPGVTLYDIDDLQNVVDGNMMERKRAAVFAEAIIEDQVDEFLRWLGSQFVIPTVAALKRRGEEIKQKELLRAFNKLGDLSEHDRKVIGSLANSIVNQLLHTPVKQLKEYALTEKGPVYTEAINKLFCLDEAAEEPKEHRPFELDVSANALGRR